MAITTCISDAWERKETLWLLELRIARLQDIPKKILAMYYFENVPLSQIAACFGLTESEITRIRAKTVRRAAEGTLKLYEVPGKPF